MNFDATARISSFGICCVGHGYRFRFVNSAVGTMHENVPADAFVGSTIRDIIGDFATEPKARLRRVELVGWAGL